VILGRSHICSFISSSLYAHLLSDVNIRPGDCTSSPPPKTPAHYISTVAFTVTSIIPLPLPSPASRYRHQHHYRYRYRHRHHRHRHRHRHRTITVTTVTVPLLPPPSSLLTSASQPLVYTSPLYYLELVSGGRGFNFLKYGRV